MKLLILCLSWFGMVVSAAPADFQQLYEKWSEKCNHQHVSLVDDGRDYLTSNMPWSMNRELIHSFINNSNSLAPCTTLKEIVENIQLPISQYKCSIPWLSQQEIFNVFSSFSMIFWYGDSLTRHMTNALYILLRQDLEFGAFPSSPSRPAIESTRRQLVGQPKPRSKSVRPPPPPRTRDKPPSVSHKNPQTTPVHNAAPAVPQVLTDYSKRDFSKTLIVKLKNNETPRNIWNQINPPYSHCACDSQFSEAKICSLYKQHFLSFTNMEKIVPGCSSGTNAIAKCDSTTEFVFAGAWFDIKKTHANYFVPSTRNGPNNNQCSTDKRPVLFSLQGGGHFDTNGTYFVKEYLTPFIENIHHYSEVCKQQSVKAGVKPVDYNIYIIVSGVPTVSKFNEDAYPHQGPKQAVEFHKIINAFLAAKYPHIQMLNFMSLTKEGLGTSYDGYHSNTDVNLMRAMIMLNAMKLILSDTVADAATALTPTANGK